MEDSRSATGKVKWFDPVRGFGFVHSDDEGKDILIHAQVLRDSGWQILYQGVTVTCEYVDTEKGLQATKVLSVEPDTLGRSYITNVAQSVGNLGGGGFVSACVKWYSDARGYGFLTCGIGTPDIFLHSDVVHRSGRDFMGVGELVEVRFSMRPQGLVALELKPASATAATADMDEETAADNSFESPQVDSSEAEAEAKDSAEVAALEEAEPDTNIADFISRKLRAADG